MKVGLSAGIREFVASLIREFTVSLSTLDWRKLTPDDIAKIDAFIDSDGCTGVSQNYRDACVIHDYWYRTHIDFDLSPITRAEADRRFRLMIQASSPFGILSPMSWWRWLGVRAGGWHAYGKKNGG